MNTSQSKSSAVVLETRYVWGRTIQDAMDEARWMEARGWKIQGNPAPMIWNNEYGTGVSITREVYE
jgi:hypothetical protein